MITAALHSTPVSPPARAYAQGNGQELARIAAEVAERIEEMDELKFGSGADFVCRLATVARTDRGAFSLLVAVLHGRVDCILDSYAAQGERTGREKQTMHYRLLTEIDVLRTVFPEAGAMLDQIRLSVRHHEDPQSRADVLRSTHDEE